MSIEAQPIEVVGTDGSPRLGIHFAPLAPVDVRRMGAAASASALWRHTHHKRWVWLTLITEQHLFALAVVHLGWGSTAFLYVLDRRTRSMLFDRTYTGLPLGCSVSDGCEEGCAVTFRALRCSISLHRLKGASSWVLEAQAHDLSVRATIDSAGAPSPIATVANVPEGGVHVTEKRVLLPVRGHLLVGDRFVRLDDAMCGFDYTQGMLARRTSWRWAFSMGRCADGRAVAFNLVEGFNGGRESAVWLDGHVVPLPPVEFVFERERPLAPWIIGAQDGSIRLRFRADAVHAARLQLGPLRSDFLQPAGTFSGTIEVPGHEPATIDDSAGVAEYQDVVW